MTETQCSEKVWDSRSWHQSQCLRPAKVERDGKWYCTIHDPEYKKAREQKRKDKYEANSCKKCGYHFMHDFYRYCPMCGQARKSQD